MSLTQADRILHHITTRGPINPDEAQRLYNCWRLAAVISILREDHIIDTHRLGKSGFASYAYVRKIESQKDLTFK